MGKDKDPSEGPGGEGDQDKQGDPKGQPEPGKDTKNGGEGNGEGGDDQDRPQFVTPDVLQGVLDARQRTTTAEFRKSQDQIKVLQASIETLTKSLAEKDKPDSSGGDKGSKSKDTESPELIKLRRKVDELTKSNEAADARAAKERQQRLDTDFKNTVTAALVAAGCEKPDEAFLVIKPRLQRDPEDENHIYSTVQSTYGDEEVDLKTYIERHFREDILPHVFKGKMRTGASVGGDSGSGPGMMTQEQAFDVEEYAKDPDKFRTAVEQGRVRGLKKPSAAK